MRKGMRDYRIMFNNLLAWLLYIVLRIYMNGPRLRRGSLFLELHVSLMCGLSGILLPILWWNAIVMLLFFMIGVN